MPRLLLLVILLLLSCAAAAKLTPYDPTRIEARVLEGAFADYIKHHDEVLRERWREFMVAGNAYIRELELMRIDKPQAKGEALAKLKKAADRFADAAEDSAKKARRIERTVRGIK